jgi:8-oxo-dGTP pyrophosphatase MutT (NUDIX family)
LAAIRARGGRWAYRLALLGLRAWWVVARPRSSGVRCVLRHGDAIVLVRHTYGDRRWMLPGGRMRRGEEPADTARREMRGELGIDARGWRVVGRVPAREAYRRSSRDEGFRRHTTTYVAADLATTTLTLRAAEIEDAGWFRPQALPAERAEAVDEAAARGWLDAPPRDRPAGQPGGGDAGNCSSTHSGPSTGRR